MTLTCQQRSGLLSHPLIVLAGLSAYSYFVVFMFEVECCRYFGVPLELLPGPLSKSASVVTFVLLLGLALWFGAVVYSYASPIFKVRNRFVRISASVFLSAFFFFCLFVLWASWYAAAFGTGTAWVLLFGGRRLWRLIKSELFDTQGHVHRNKLREWTRLRLSFAFLVGVILFILAMVVGQAAERIRTQFVVLPPQARGDPELVVLYSAGEYFICAPLQRQKRETERTFILLSRLQLSQEKRLLQVENIGPLHPVPVPAPDITRLPLLKLAGHYIRSRIGLK
jgi:hypothetical protein